MVVTYQVGEYVKTDGRLHVLRCPGCAMQFAIPVAFEELRREDNREFYCPAGHPMSYTERAIDKVQREMKAEQERLRWAREDAENLRNSLKETNASLSATKGVVTRMRKRAQAGLCVICNRHFTPLERHMETKHGEAQR